MAKSIMITAEGLRQLEEELDILKGEKRKEIAEELCITENTVKKHISSIFSKLEIDNRNALYDKINQL